MFKTVALVLLGTSLGFGFSLVSDGNGFAIKVPSIEAGKLECHWLSEDISNNSYNREFLEPRN
ncbi:MAG: hypothetical protein O4861_09815 [Trichodesmium sp. St16_bin4-tuft]|uniref:hypothetical protein n=1 Tax=Trichodesmium erythraeum TaxID=1206 RepID=UPI00003C9AB7|nr:hypothetical protein [Trichodesmium erythraeum GBRTRLIN201]MCH2050346.1 hypothetical protein [Trichodesmium sp. ALOHA_ZT_67]MCL2930277.1 hypothetical protein [Trichodesmium sp. MAG_R01]MDE5069052.1 hypothetical protein [Trichodesmium sp. St4_bin8_1]MDE5071697.1 hypothetical protein [Trichodesmium sp. St5_bin8]MDE5091419.1 hypothetical protein [Trichodesmium sp. St18_bin3_1_1]MDE5095596.1 hypothetical protein [Trichodesmium sp. St11_bin5]MDE5098616.1 hypothetical protein [Trichodesmium sp.